MAQRQAILGGICANLWHIYRSYAASFKHYQQAMKEHYTDIEKYLNYSHLH